MTGMQLTAHVMMSRGISVMQCCNKDSVRDGQITPLFVIESQITNYSVPE